MTQRNSNPRTRSPRWLRRVRPIVESLEDRIAPAGVWEHVEPLGSLTFQRTETGQVGGTVALFSADFESGSLPAAITTTSSTANGRVVVSNVLGTPAHGGNFHLAMDTTVNGPNNLNEAILTVNLAGQTDVGLSFWHKDLLDEDTALPASFVGSFNGDGVSISANGVNWHRLTSLNNANSPDGVYTQFSFDLDQAAANAGIALGNNFKIKFQQFDNFSFGSDGRTFDDIAVTVPGPLVDTQSFFLQAGQKLTVVATPDESSATLSVTVRNPSNAVIGTATASGPGETVDLQTLEIATSGSYTVEVTGNVATEYDLNLFRNATVEVVDSDDGAEQDATGSLIELGSGRFGIVGTFAPTGGPGGEGEVFVYGTQRGTGLVVRIDPATGAILSSFAAPNTLSPNHTFTGLSFAEDGGSLLYLNPENQPTSLYRLNPTTGSVLSTAFMPAATTGSINRAGLSFDSAGGQNFIFGVNNGAPVDRQVGFGGPVAAHFGSNVAFAGALGGDDNGRQFVVANGRIEEFHPSTPNTLLGTLPLPTGVGTVSGLGFDGTNIYLSNITGTLWTIDATTGAVVNQVAIQGGEVTALAADFIGAPPPKQSGPIFTTHQDGTRLGTIDQATGVGTDIGPFGSSQTWAAAFDTDGTLYTTINGFSGNAILARVNQSTGAITTVGTGLGTNMISLEIADDGTMYGIGYSNRILYRINQSTGVATPIGDTGILNNMDLAFDSNGTLYATVGNTLRTVNPSTGASTLVGTFTGIQTGHVMGIMFDVNDTLYATAHVSNSPLYEINLQTLSATVVGNTTFVLPHGGDIYITSTSPSDPFAEGGTYVNHPVATPDLYGEPGEPGRLPPGPSAVAQATPPDELLVNGSFETGTFAGWTTVTTGTPFQPWAVTGAGQGGGFNMLQTQPQDGTWVAWNGFDGGGPFEFQMFQDVTISAGATATLNWMDRVQWNFTLGGQATLPRLYTVEIRNPSTNATLQTVYSFSTGTQATNPTGNTNWLTHSVDVSAFAGQTVRLMFREQIPQSGTGPGQIEFDAISLTEESGGGGGTDVDEYLIDLTGKAGQPIDIALSTSAGGGGGGAPFSDSLTQTNNVFAPNVLNFNFNGGVPTPGGDGTLVVDVLADLGATTEFLTLNAEGIFTQNLFVNDGVEQGPGSTTVTIPLAILEQLAADGTISFTVTPSAAVNNFGSNSLTLNLSYATAGVTATLELLDVDGTTVLATGVAEADNFDLGILDFIVPAGGVYTIRVTSDQPGTYGIVVTDPLVFDTDVSQATTRTTVFEEDFESGSLPTEITTSSSTANGRVLVSNTLGTPTHGGSFHLTMDRSPSGPLNLNEAILTLDLTGLNDVELSFWHKDVNDEDTALPATFVGSANGDGIAISADGVTWHRLTSFTNANSPNNVYTQFTFNLSDAAANAGISLGANFRIKFQQFDDFPFISDGRTFDDIVVSADSDLPLRSLDNVNGALGFLGGEHGGDVDLSLINSFQSLNLASSGFIPPDPIIAAGPQTVITMVNTDIAIHNKATGAVIAQADLDGAGGFWNTTNVVFDPWITYDPHSNRFIAMGIDRSTAGSGSSRVYLAVSTSANPTNLTTHWHKYVIDRTGTHQVTGGTTFPDYEKLGVDEHAIYITGNDFGILSGGFSHVSLFAIHKAPLLSGGPANILYDENITGAFSIHPMLVRDTGSPMYFAERVGNTQIRIHAITDILGTPSRITSTVTVPQYLFPPDVPQQGGQPLDSVDQRIMSGVVQDGSLWTAHAIQDPAVDLETVVRWYEFDVSNFPGGPATLVQSGNVDPGPGVHTWMPHINVDNDGDMAIGFSISGPSQFAGMAYTGRLASDPLGTTRPIEIAQAGLGSYGLFDSIGRNRWGDYSGLALDPDGETFWVYNEYAGTGNTWNTFVGSFQVEASAALPEEDAYTITLSAGQAIGFITSTPFDSLAGDAVHNLLDPEIEVLDPNGNPVAFDTSSAGDGKNALVTFTAPIGGVYKVIVRRQAAGGDGEYLLKVLREKQTTLKVDDYSPGDPLRDFNFRAFGPGWVRQTGGGYNGDYLIHADGQTNEGPNNFVQWTMRQNPGTGEIFVSWLALPGNATNAKYSIYDGGTLLAEVEVDQTKTPDSGIVADLLGNLIPIKSLGVYNFSTLFRIVRLSSEGNGAIVADAAIDPPVQLKAAIVESPTLQILPTEALMPGTVEMTSNTLPRMVAAPSWPSYSISTPSFGPEDLIPSEDDSDDAELVAAILEESTVDDLVYMGDEWTDPPQPGVAIPLDGEGGLNHEPVDDFLNELAPALSVVAVPLDGGGSLEDEFAEGFTDDLPPSF